MSECKYLHGVIGGEQVQRVTAREFDGERTKISRMRNVIRTRFVQDGAPYPLSRQIVKFSNAVKLILARLSTSNHRKR